MEKEAVKMSMNLFYAVNTPQGIDDGGFEFQTPTELTHAVLKHTDKSKQMRVLRDFIISKDWWDAQEKIEVITRIETMLMKDNVTLATG